MSEWDLIWRLAVALGLSAAIGLEREIRQKSAGLRTHTLVGLGSALFLLVSEFGFADVLHTHGVTLDPSRVAAQIVSGIGFIGGGLIFVRRDAVRGLTTAASVWVVAAVGMAAAGDLPILATTTTLMYFLVTLAFPPLMRWMPGGLRAPSELTISYQDGRGVLRHLLARCVEAGFAVSDLATDRHEGEHGHGEVLLRLQLRGKGSLADLATELNDVDGVLAVDFEDVYEVAA